jgi:hypothetical protein
VYASILCVHKHALYHNITTPGNSLGQGITNVDTIQPLPTDCSLVIPAAVDTAIILILTYDKVNITCIKLPRNIMRKTATYGSDIYETLWTVNQPSTSTIRLLAVTAVRINSIINSWCIATVKHGSNDIDIMHVNSDKTIKQLAHIKGPAITVGTDVIGAIVLQTCNMKVQLVAAYKHDSTLRVYDTVHGRELCKPIAIGISGDTIADMFIDAYSNSVFTTSTWLPSLHCWSLEISTRRTSKYLIDVATAELESYTVLKDKQSAKGFERLMACIQQQPPTLLTSLALVSWCAEVRCIELLQLLLDRKMSPFVKGKCKYTASLSL